MTKIRNATAPPIPSPRNAARRALAVPLPALLLVLLLTTLLAGCSAHREAGTGNVAFRLVWDRR